MSANELKILEARGNNAVKKLREANFEKGFPFLINSKDLPGNQCYLEYPDGRIALVCVQSKDAHDFTLIRELTHSEIEGVRKKYHLA
jgi:hypothetical protein